MEIVKLFKNYVIIRKNTKFPNYDINDDVDILTDDIHFNLNIMKQNNFVINKLNKFHYHCDRKENNKLIFRIDLYSKLLYNKVNIHEKYSSLIIKNKIPFLDFYIPKIDDDLALRYIEYIENPNKIKHLNYINQHKNKDCFQKPNTLLYLNNYNSRYESCIIWCHGIQYYDRIFEMIRQFNKILYIKKIKITNLDIFLNTIYEFDNSLKEHIKAKSKHLYQFEKKCILVIFKNYDLNLNNDNKCQSIEKLKWSIRNEFNPRHTNSNYQISPKLEKGITHDHVIHTSDTEKETINILKFLKLNTNLNEYDKIKNESNNYKLININDINCNILQFDDINKKVYTKIMKIQDTPHYQHVIGNKNIYKEYYERYMGLELTDDHSPSSFENLIEKFDCEKYNSNPTMYIKTNSKLVILDGCHRVSILMNNGFKQIYVKITK